MNYIMITLDYQLSPSWNQKNREVNLTSADETTLRYEVLLGDICIEANTHDFSAKWGWIPIVDFVASLRLILRQLVDDDEVECALDFTESDAVLRFKRAKDDVLISASYAPGVACIPLTELTAEVETFSHRVARELSQQYPPLRANKSFQQLLSIPSN